MLVRISEVLGRVQLEERDGRNTGEVNIETKMDNTVSI